MGQGGPVSTAEVAQACPSTAVTVGAVSRGLLGLSPRGWGNPSTKQAGRDARPLPLPLEQHYRYPAPSALYGSRPSLVFPVRGHLLSAQHFPI